MIEKLTRSRETGIAGSGCKIHIRLHKSGKTRLRLLTFISRCSFASKKDLAAWSEKIPGNQFSFVKIA